MTDSVSAQQVARSIEGQCITRVSFDCQVRLLTDGGWEIVLETGCALGAENPVDFDPDAASEASGSLVALRDSCISQVEISHPGGSLTVELEPKQRLVVPSSARYEAWQLRGPTGELIICCPGGELQVWAGHPIHHEQRLTNGKLGVANGVAR